MTGRVRAKKILVRTAWNEAESEGACKGEILFALTNVH
jgi:hypothetical protein